MLIADACLYIERSEGINAHLLSEEELLSHITKVISPLLDFFRSASGVQIQEKFSKLYGEGGVKQYHFTMSEIIFCKNPEFGGDDLKNWIHARDDVRRTSTHKDVIELSERITDYVFAVLKKIHGTTDLKSGEKAYWDIGIESSSAKEAAYKRQQAELADQRLPKEAYVDILDLMKIVRQKNNWEHFKDTMNLRMESEGGGKVYYLDWMEKFNEVRRIPAHSSSHRVYSENDYAFVTWLKRELYARPQFGELK